MNLYYLKNKNDKMAGKKISELQRLTEITGQELLPVARGGQNYSIFTSLLQGGGATKLNDYMYDVSALMGKMAVRGTKGTSKSTNPYGNGYYNTDGEYIEGSTNTYVDTILVDPNKVYHFDIGGTNLSSLTNPAILVLFDEDDSVIQSVPLTAAGFRDRYLAFTSSVKKYGVTYMVSPTVQPQPPVYNETYEIQDINDVLSGISEKSNSMRDDFNNYVYDISGLLGKLAYRDGIGTDEKNIQGDGYFNSKGILVQSSSAGFVYQKLEINSSKIYRIRQMVGSYSTVSALVLFDEHDEIISAVPYNYTSVSSDKYFVFAGVHSVGISFVESDNNSRLESFDISDITTVINTNQGNRALYVAAGAVYNKQTGFYELNGLTDITEEQMRNIYVYTSGAINQNNLKGRFRNVPIRTNLPFKANSGDYFGDANIGSMFATNHTIEVVYVGSIIYTNYISYAFVQCDKLRKILTVIDLNNYEIGTQITTTFKGCILLEYVRIQKIKQSISFSDSPLLSLESLQYLITNAANTSAITVTVHADVYAKIQDETQTDWHALIASAQEKQITFAIA